MPPEPLDFDGLVRRCSGIAYSVAYRYCGSDSEARDLVQEAFLRAFRHRFEYDPTRPFEPWLTTILRNVWLDAARRYDRRHGVSLDADPGDDGPSYAERLPGRDSDPLDLLAARERDERVQAALTGLPLHYRAAVELCDVEGLPYERIAADLGIPLGTVRSRIHKGRLLLRRALEDRAPGRLNGGRRRTTRLSRRRADRGPGSRRRPVGPQVDGANSVEAGPYQ